MKLLTAIPVYNEERHLESVLHEVRRYSPHILVVNDGSTDGTAELLAKQTDLHVVTHEQNRGYGAALVSAFDYALHQSDCDVLVTMDCDGQHEPSRIPVLLEAIHDGDIVSGSRYLREFRQHTLPTPADRLYINQTITRELNEQLGLNLTDAFCGFKAYRRQALGKLRVTETGWGMPLQVWVQAAKLGLRIKEVGVPRLYLDPNRAFGGMLNDAGERLAYYRRIIAEALVEHDHVVRLVARLSSRDEELSVSLPALRAPKEHGQILAVPALDQVGALAAHNRHQLDSVSISSSGKSLSELRELARREILLASDQYLREAGQQVKSSEPDAPARDAWLVAGHQPELFHPGVWFKNFALHQLAQQHAAIAINLVVDTDAAKPALLHAPDEGRIARVPYDRSSLETPYEERTVVEESTFAELPRRMAAITAKWNFEPMLPAFWREVIRHAGRTPLLGERFAAGRRAMERQWGVSQREVPMSRVCQTEAFAWFACAILQRLVAFHDDYNQVVHDYRQAHGIRSRSHPVPDLTADGAWLEAPFWAWRQGRARRGKLMVRSAPDAWQLRVGNEEWPSIPRHRLDRAVEAWHALETQGYKIRSRALTTTLFARLFLADVFIHGIGGGIYDELTDRLIERFFLIPAPGFVVLSATLLLPLPRYPDAAKRAAELARQERDIVYKPERFVSAGAAANLVADKRAWIARPTATHAECVERFHGIRAINAGLQPFITAIKERVATEHEEQLRRAASDAVAARRDYAFCLYPEEMLRRFFAMS